MRPSVRRVRELLVAWVLTSASATAVGAQAPARDSGAIVGTVTLQEEARPERPPRYYRGQYRAHLEHDDEPAEIRNVAIYIEQLPAPAGGWTPAAEPARMRQHHDRFVPHVLPVLRGTTVAFPNDDSYYHNVFSVVAGDRFDLGRYGQGDTRLQTFDDPAVVVVRCEIHAGMKAYILVRDNPFFTTADDDGRFRLEGVPAGTWTVVAWHPTRGTRRHPIVVEAGSDVPLDVSF